MIISAVTESELDDPKVVKESAYVPRILDLHYWHMMDDLHAKARDFPIRDDDLSWGRGNWHQARESKPHLQAWFDSRGRMVV